MSDLTLSSQIGCRKMDFLQKDSVSYKEIKEEICLKDEAIERFAEDASSTMSHRYSDLHELNFEHDMISVSSSFFIIS